MRTQPLRLRAHQNNENIGPLLRGPINPTKTKDLNMNGTANHTRVSNSEARESLRRRQAEHLRNVKKNRDAGEPNDSCAHDRCSDCVGTFVKLDGSKCIHMISCTCSRCVPTNPRLNNPLLDVMKDRQWYYTYPNRQIYPFPYWDQRQIPNEVTGLKENWITV